MCYYLGVQFSSVQFNSVAQSCPTFCNPMNRSTPGLPVYHQPLEFPQIHAHRVGDAIEASHPLSSPSPPAPNPSHHQGLFQWVNSSHQVAKVLGCLLQHQSFQWTPRTDLLQDGLVESPCSSRNSKSLLQHHSSKTSIFRPSAFFAVQLSHPYMTTGKTIALARQTFVGNSNANRTLFLKAIQIVFMACFLILQVYMKLKPVIQGEIKKRKSSTLWK